MRSVAFTSRTGTPSRSLLRGCALLVAGVALAGCDGSDGDGDVSTSPPIVVATPSPDAGCSDEYPHNVDLPTEFVFLVKACDAPNRRAARVENLSNGVMVVGTAEGGPTITFTPLSVESLTYQLTNQATTLGLDAPGTYRLGPEAVVLASADVEGGPHLTLKYDATASIAGVAANALAEAFTDRFAPLGQRAVVASAECIEGVVSVYDSFSGTGNDLLNAMLESSSCYGLYRLMDGPAVDGAESVLRRQASRLVPIWEDLARVVGRLVRP